MDQLLMKNFPRVLIGLLAALLTQVLLARAPALPAGARVFPTSAPPAAASRPAGPVQPAATLEPAAAAPTPHPPSPTPVPSPRPTAQPTPTPGPDLLERCARIDRLGEAERTLALGRLSWAPDQPGAVVIPSCNLVSANQPEVVVLHYTAGSLNGAIHRFLAPGEASAHYIIDRDGTIYQMVPERYGAYHVNCYNRRSYCLAGCPVCSDPAGRLSEPYRRSIGVELVNLGPVDETRFAGALYEDYQMAFGFRYWEDYPPEQLAALQRLVAGICARWNIPLDAAHIIGHSRINHKADPGPALNLFWPRYGSPARPALWSPPNGPGPD